MPRRRKTWLFVVGLTLIASLAVSWIGRALALRGASRVIREHLESDLILAEDFLARLDPGSGSTVEEEVRELSRKLDLPVSLHGPTGDLLARSEDTVGLPAEGVTSPHVDEALRLGQSVADDVAKTPAGVVLYGARRIESEGRLLGAVLIAVPEDRLFVLAVPGTLTVLFRVAPVLAVFAILVLAAGRRPVGAMLRVRIQAERLVEELLGQDLESIRDSGLNALARDLGKSRRIITRMLRELEAGKALSSSVLASMREGVLAVGPDERVIFQNDAALDLLRPRDLPVEGKPLYEVTRVAAASEAYRAVLNGEGDQERKFRIENGAERHIEIRVVTLKDAEGERIGALGVLFDVTQLEVLETVRQTFIANVSHELRTPLAAIKAYTETLLEDALQDPDNARSFLEVVLRHSARMEALVNDLTDLSLIETGAVPLDESILDLGALVEDVLDQLEPQASSRDVALRADLPADLSISGDRMRLEQVLVNVVDNAIKFTPSGTAVRVAAWRSGNGTVVSIEDEGAGIPNTELEKIFHRFYRVDKARSRELGGTGLGLSIVKHLMRLHGGSARAENRSEGGARILLEFPPLEEDRVVEETAGTVA